MNDVLNFVKTERDKVERSLKITSWISIALMMMVFTEALYVRIALRSALMPEKIGSIAINSVYEYIPELNRMLVESTATAAPLAADALVDYSLKIISGIGPITQENTLLLVDKLMADLHAEGAPAFQKVLLDAYGDVYAERDNLQNPEFAQIAINDLLDIWELELEGKLGNGTTHSLDYLDKQIQALYVTPDPLLTPRQRAQKRTLICGQILVDRAINK